jgi:hypothetical protein
MEDRFRFVAAMVTRFLLRWILVCKNDCDLNALRTVEQRAFLRREETNIDEARET